MPLTIVAVAALGWAMTGMTLAGALLLGAVLAPTDPVLAGDVQVGPPLEGREHPVRFALTTEAGLNDGGTASCGFSARPNERHSGFGTMSTAKVIPRAFNLAHPGRYSGWKAIEDELPSEGFSRAADILNDGRVREELDSICAEATMGTYRDT